MPLSHKVVRKDLQSVIGQLRSLAEASPDERVLRDLEAAECRMSEAVFKLAVLGEYKRGKSTLINALLRAQVLPTGILPLTSIVTEVRYGPEARTTIEFLDGRSLSVRPEQLPTFVTEPGNPRNEKAVRRAIVHNSSQLLREGVVIVDTPGIGSVYEHNSAAAYGYLDEADAVVIVLAADQPLSAEERSLIRALSDITDRILFVVNRVDVLTAEDAATSVRFIRDTLQALEGRSPELVFPLSARLAFEARVGREVDTPDFEAFGGALHSALVEQKSDVLAERSRALARRAADILALRLQTERHAGQLKLNEIARAIERLEGATNEVGRRLEHSEQLLRFEVEDLHRVELKRRTDEASSEITAALWPKVEASLEAAERDSLRHRVATLASAVGEWAVQEVRRYYRGTEPLVQGGLEQSLAWHTQRVHVAAGDIIKIANELLGMSVTVPAALAPLSEKPRFHLRDWDYSGGQLRGSTWRLWLPRRWSKPKARELLRELLERRVSQNLEAVRYDWSLRLDEAVRQFLPTSRRQLSEISEAITGALRRAHELRDETDGAVRAASLDRTIEQVVELRQRLSSQPNG